MEWRWAKLIAHAHKKAKKTALHILDNIKKAGMGMGELGWEKWIAS